jgi:hypothetical protein
MKVLTSILVESVIFTYKAKYSLPRPGLVCLCVCYVTILLIQQQSALQSTGMQRECDQYC